MAGTKTKKKKEKVIFALIIGIILFFLFRKNNSKIPVSKSIVKKSNPYLNYETSKDAQRAC
jgi:hypothetical protein